MKKIIGIIAIALTTVFFSCNMDKYPHNQVIQKIVTFDNAKNIRVGLYSSIKSITTGAYFNISDFQSDLFDATSYFGNYRGLFYQWSLVTIDQDIAAMWYGWYGVIAQCNFLINGIEELDKSHLTDSQKKDLELWTGEAHWLRAYCYYNLAINWCQVYDPASANDENTGLLLQTVYAPTADAKQYPGRSTLFATFKLITDDIAVAKDKVDSKNTVGSFYITPDVVTALRARVALWMKDYTTAAADAQSLIISNRYKLVNTDKEFAALWKRDSIVSEVMMMSQMANVNDLGNATGELFLWGIDGNDKKWQPQYIPTQTVLNLYAEDDIRFTNYFQLSAINNEDVGSANLYVITKYPGNPALRVSSGTNNYMNKGKVFRIAEMFLIAAEALAEEGDDATASQLLNDLRTARSASWINTPYVGGTLMEEIRNERIKEMMADGVRFTDLKRWGLGMDRSADDSQPVAAFIFSDDTHSLLKIDAGDYRFLWPIPKQETDCNKKVQQNPFY